MMKPTLRLLMDGHAGRPASASPRSGTAQGEFDGGDGGGPRQPPDPGARAEFLRRLFGGGRRTEPAPATRAEFIGGLFVGGSGKSSFAPDVPATVVQEKILKCRYDSRGYSEFIKRKVEVPNPDYYTEARKQFFEYILTGQKPIKC